MKLEKKARNNFSKKDYLKYQQEIISQEDNSSAIISLIDVEKYQPLKKGGLLSKTDFGIKDNFAIKGAYTTSGSKLLKNFEPNYSATVFKKLIEAGATPLFKTNLDELAMGATGLTSNYQKVYNPFNKKKIIGGSSSGSAYVVAKGLVDFSLGSDTGDSVRKPAVYAGIVGFKPTWGIVSRYGLFDFAPTWDTVGWFTQTVKLSAKILDVLQGYDSKDASSIQPRDKNYFKDLSTSKKFKIGIIKPFLEDIFEPKIITKHQEVINKLKEDGHQIIELDVDLNIFKTILVIYRVISSIESLSCNANLTGFLFGSDFGDRGSFDERIIKARTNGFNYEVKRRFLFAAEGMINNEKIYHNARKVRTLIIEALEKVFNQVDALVMPAHSSFAPNVTENTNVLRYGSFMDDYLGLFNANGSPSITVPVEKNGEKSIAVNIATKPFNDKKCLQIAKIIEDHYE